MKNSIKFLFIIGLIGILVSGLSIYAAPRTTLRFMWWGGETRHKVTMEAIEQYMSKNPNVRISGEYSGYGGYQQKLLTQLAGGTAADIIQIDLPWLADLMAQKDFFADLNHVKEIKLNEFDKNVLNDQCSWRGKLVGLPTGLNGLIYVVNRDFLNKHKISPNTQWNWDNLLETGTRINRENKNDYLLSMGVTHTGRMLKMYIKQHTGAKQWVNDDFTLGFDKQILTQGFTYYQNLLKSGTLQPLSDSILFESKTEQNPRWPAGQIGMDQTWVSSAFLFYLDGRVNVDVMLPPVMKGSKNSGIIVQPSQILVINAKTTQLKEAAKFINWFFNDPEAVRILKTERGIPPTSGGQKLLEELKLLDANMVKGINLATKNAGIFENGLSNNKELITIFDEYIQKVGFGKITPEAAADQMIKDYQSKLAELKRQL